jgi:hypothetical protein
MPGSARELNGKRLLSKGEEMKKLIAILLVAFASAGCVASGIRYRPCHELRTDMSVSNDEYDNHCPRRGD